MSPFRERYGDSSEPLVEMGNDSAARLMSDELGASVSERTNPKRHAYLAEKPCNQISKNDGFVRLGITCGRGDAGCVPQVGFPFIEKTVAS